MNDSFEPQNAFEGIVYEKLQNIEKRLDKLPCSETDRRLRKVEGDISNIKGKAAIIGGLMGVCAAWLKSVIWR